MPDLGGTVAVMADQDATADLEGGTVRDTHAFVGPVGVLLEGAVAGPLAGSMLAVKDVIDVVGRVTGAGNPDLAAAREPAERSAPVVEALVAAGATVVGKTVTDELAYSLGGDNVHFPPPVNPADSARTTGGSSSGSAAAVAAGIVDLALGTDTGGSVRVPASYCGILGWRPTHGSVSTDGLTPLAPSFDTVGLFARSGPLLRAAAEVLLATGGDRSPATGTAGSATGSPAGFAVVAELMDLVEPAEAEVLRAEIHDRFGDDIPTVRLGLDLDECLATFRTLQGSEAWAAHGEWIRTARPALGENTAFRFDAASKVTSEQVAAAEPVRERVRRAIVDATADGTVLLAPAAAGPAPLRGEYGPEAERIRADTLRSTVVASLAGSPVVVIPTSGVRFRSATLPLGLAEMGAPGSDLALVDQAFAAIDAH